MYIYIYIYLSLDVYFNSTHIYELPFGSGGFRSGGFRSTTPLDLPGSQEQRGHGARERLLELLHLLPLASGDTKHIEDGILGFAMGVDFMFWGLL